MCSKNDFISLVDNHLTEFIETLNQFSCNKMCVCVCIDWLWIFLLLFLKNRCSMPARLQFEKACVNFAVWSKKKQRNYPTFLHKLRPQHTHRPFSSTLLLRTVFLNGFLLLCCVLCHSRRYRSPHTYSPIPKRPYTQHTYSTQLLSLLLLPMLLRVNV